MRPYERLSDSEFEDLIGDLLGAEEDRRYERFARGPDLGIDLRHIEGDQIDVVQVKHYPNSTYSQLRTRARKEAKRLAELDAQPTSYRLVTSRALTPLNKDELAGIFERWMRGPEDVLGVDDVEALLGRHAPVERNHVKLWLSSGTALKTMLDADVYNRSKALITTIDTALPRYVQTDAFLRAHAKLGEEKVVLISGKPGIGKTTMAQMLVADAIKQEFEPVEISADIEEAWRVTDSTEPQVFYYDDFLGRTTMGEMAKNEDRRLVDFMAEVARRPNALFVLTTREYILKQANALYESFEQHGIDGSKFLLTLDDYGPMERAKILYNHVFHAGSLPEQARRSLVEGQGYLRIVEHSRFNPRLIETFTGDFGEEQVLAGVDFVDYAVSILDDPELVWRRVFDNQIGGRERALLYALSSMPAPARQDDLERAYISLASKLGEAADAAGFRAALQILDDSLLATDFRDDEHIVDFANPSVEDFMRRRLRGEPGVVSALLDSSIFFDQVPRLISRLRPEWGPDLATQVTVAEACVRLFESEAALLVPFEDVWGRRTFERGPAYPEQRLVLLLELIDFRAKEFSEVLAAASERLGQIVERWREGKGNEVGALALAHLLEQEDAPLAMPAEFFTDLHHMLEFQLSQPGDFARLLEFRESKEELFEPDELDEISARFLDEAHADLTQGLDTFTSTEEVDSYLEIARRLDVQLDEEIVEAAMMEIVGKADAEEERQYEQLRDRAEAEEEAPDPGPAMDALFGRLLD